MSAEVEELLAKEKATLVKALEERVQNRKDNVCPGPHRLAGPKLKELKADVKKATAFAKKVKGFSAEHADQILADLKVLNVNMFASECAQSLPQVLHDGKLAKMSETVPFLQVWCSLHQKYEKFSEDALGHLKKTFSIAPIIEEMEVKFDPTAPAADVTKTRILIKVWCDLWISGVVPSCGFADAVMAQILKALEAKKEAHLTVNALALVLLIFKNIGPEIDPDVFSVPAVSSAKDAQAKVPEEAIAVAQLQTELKRELAKGANGSFSEEKERLTIRKRLGIFSDKVIEFAQKLKKQVEGQWRNLCERTELHGEMTAEVKEKFGKLRAEVDKFVCLSNQLVLCGGRATLKEGQEGSSDLLLKPVDLSVALQRSAVDEAVVFTSGLQDFYSVKDIESVSRYDDDDQRSFYENLLDIDDLFGPSSKDGSHGGVTLTAGGGEAKKDGPDADAGPQPITLSDVGVSASDASGPGSAILSSTEKAELDYTRIEELLSRLHQSAAKEYMDTWIVDFIAEIQRLYTNPEVTKTTTDEDTSETTTRLLRYSSQQASAYMSNCLKMLIGELRFAPTNSVEMLPFLARCIATFSKKYCDMGDVISGKLEGEVQHAVKDKEQQAYRRKMRGVKYICELVKFKVAPPIRAIRLMKLCLEDWEHAHNVEMFICLLEGCGSYLMRGGMTREKMEGILADLHKAKMRFGVRDEYEALLENAVLAVKTANNPVVKRAPRGRKKSPLEQYVSYLLFSALNEDTFVSVRRKVRTLPWISHGKKRQQSAEENAGEQADAPSVAAAPLDLTDADLCCQVMRRADKCSWDRMHLLAEVIADVTDVHGWVGVNIVDSLLESLRLDLEHPDNRTQQARLQDLKLLGELFNFRIIAEEVLFYCLALFALYHPASATATAAPEKKNTSAGEAPQLSGAKHPTDYSRIRCVVTLLETSGPYLLDKKTMTAKTRTLLRVLLGEFFMLVHTKQKPLPLDLDYKLAEVIKEVSKSCNNRRGEADIVFPSTYQAARDQATASMKLLQTTKTSEAAWLIDVLGTLKENTTQDLRRIYPVAQKIAPVGLGDTSGELTKDGPRVTPLESHREDDEEDSDDDSDDDSDYSDSDSDDSDYSDSDDSDLTSSSDEEEEEDIFARGQFTKGGNWGLARANANKRGMTQEDREFAELLLESHKECSRQGAERSRTIQLKQGSIERNMEGKMPTRLQPYIQQASKQTIKSQQVPPAEAQQTDERSSAPPAASSASADAGAVAPAPMRFTLLRRNQNNSEKVETKAIGIPSDSAFAQKTIVTKSQAIRDQEQMAKKIAALSDQQHIDDEDEGTPGAARAAGGRGRGGQRVKGPTPQPKREKEGQADFKISLRFGGK